MNAPLGKRSVVETGDIRERISGLESAVAAIHADVAEFKISISTTLHDIQASMATASQTNWSVILTGVIVALGLYAAAIRPVENASNRLETSGATLATAVIEQNKQTQSNTLGIALNDAAIKSLRSDITDVQRYGSPITDKRLAILEDRDLGRRPPTDTRVRSNDTEIGGRP